MATKTKAARHSCHYNRAKENRMVHDTHIVSDYERGALIAGLITAVSFGSMFIHAAVML